jgi:hypothetical protein
MLARSVLDYILRDESLTRRLGDAEARVLVEFLVDQAERLGEALEPALVPAAVRRLCRRGRAVACFVRLWCLDDQPGAAMQLAGSEQFAWPLPDGPADPCCLMQHIVGWEARARRAA